MKNKFTIILVLCGYVFSPLSYSDGIVEKPKTSVWHPVIGLAGGLVSPLSLGTSTTFPMVNPLTEEYFIYSPRSGTPTGGLIEGFLGVEHGLFSSFLLQGGLTYTAMTSFQAKGSFVQGTDQMSENIYTYSYKVKTQQLLVQAKLLYPYRDIFYPYLLLGVGASFNQSSDFNNSVPTELTFTREYTDNRLTRLAYRLGLGFDIALMPQLRVGLAYRFADLGRCSLGSASMNQSLVSGTLSQDHLYVNEAVAQISYVI